VISGSNGFGEAGQRSGRETIRTLQSVRVDDVDHGRDFGAEDERVDVALGLCEADRQADQILLQAR
jgi:hypothetical protein